MFIVKSARGIAPRIRGLLQPRSVAATIGAMRPTPAELEVARALIARVEAADPSIKRAPTSCCGVRRSRMSGRRAWRRPTFNALGRWAREHLEAKAGDRLGRSATLRSSSKRLQRSTAAACSCSQLGPTRMCWPDFCATNSLVRKTPACLCQVHRLLAADRGWGARALSSRG